MATTESSLPSSDAKRQDIIPKSNYDWLLDTVIDGGYLPIPVLRMGIRRQFDARAAEIGSTSVAAARDRKMKFIEELRSREMAIATKTANQQHYEVTTPIMAAALGPRMKYSGCLFTNGDETLAQAEINMMRRYIVNGGFKDGMSILDLGCGWGSATLYFAEVFPNSKIVGFSNSKTQKEYIDGKAKEKGLKNIKVLTGDVVTFEFQPEAYDRILTVEMLEHMKNYDLLMAKIAGALKPDGKFYIHIFGHKDTPYHFEEGWMTTHFFTGGTMPSQDLLLYFQKNLVIEKQWWIDGHHYNKTAEAWLSNWRVNKKNVWPHLEETYGKENTATWFNRWTVYYLAIAEMFKYGGGESYGIIHMLFQKRQISS
ncbi:methyltransferase [Podospora didyma]|uniref:Methyltransferase n=1 Tax=Podospora didyma TaxID=330526 RepID=A0AAE0KKJ9_9PEZI|nr:methyltransferase [Podospora didyma]